MIWIQRVRAHIALLLLSMQVYSSKRLTASPLHMMLGYAAKPTTVDWLEWCYCSTIFTDTAIGEDVRTNACFRS